MMQSQPRSIRLYRLWSLLILGAIVCIDLLHRFYPQSSMYGAFDDDFFYYAQIAKHLAHGAGSTFDGIHRTNGYHPLWLLCLTLFSFGDSGRMLFPLVTITAILAVGSIFLLSMVCLRKFGVAAPGRYVIATLIAFQSELLLRGGMEIAIALPLILLLLSIYLSPRQHDALFYFRSGLLSSLCILSRLDSIFLIVLLFSFTLMAQKSPRASLGSIAVFAAGLTPLWVYFLLNKLLFKTFTPVSAQAKQLRLHRAPQLEPLRSLLHPFTTVRLLVVVPGILSTVVLLAFLLRKPDRFSPAARTVLWSLALFPIVHLAILCFLSDWPLWYWYFYPLLLSLFACMAASAAIFAPSPKAWIALAIGVSVVSLGYTTAFNVIHPPRKNALFLAARDIAGFSKTHPGIYAMGDRSGTPGYMISSPMIQLEGLVMDETYLDKLRIQPSLNSILSEYGVNYYVSSDATFKDGCYHTREPLQAGPDSACMLGAFCRQPDATFTHNGIITRIFALSGSAPQ
ncbi:MAG TPA: hypothetical protein VHW70_11085 [Edaphobacter sp.]|nr:hypothetical protein [Edaphobacter sp.]